MASTPTVRPTHRPPTSTSNQDNPQPPTPSEVPAEKSLQTAGGRGKAPHRRPFLRPVPTPEELAMLPEVIKAKVKKWTTGARSHQLECIRAQCLGHDIILQAATGSGKTGIVAGPHLLPYSEGMVTIVVSPLLALHDEQTQTFKSEFGLSAVAVNSSQGCDPATLSRICQGHWQIVIVAPEMLLSRTFTDNVLRKPIFGARCLSVFVDEAHCISHWGDSFRKEYSSIGLIRAYLPKRVPLVAVTATLSQIVRNDIITTLCMDQHNLVEVNKGNERHNVIQVVRPMQHAMNTFCDADFLVPRDTAVATDIPKALVYYDDVKGGADFVNHLNTLIPGSLRTGGLVRPYNAAMSKDYRDMLMLLFREGHVRILVCTDAAGMGCDIPDVEVVLQWKIPSTLSAWVQRAGRAARGDGRSGLAIMLVEKAAYPSPSSDEMASMTSGERSAAVRGRGRGRGHDQGRGRGHGRGRGRGRGGRGARGGGRGGHASTGCGSLNEGSSASGAASVQSGGHAPAPDPSGQTTHCLVPEAAFGEGIYEYIRTTSCRRLIIAEVFRNEKPDIDPLLCCDICNPALLKRCEAPAAVQAKKRRSVRKGDVNDEVLRQLYKWRSDMKKKHFARTIYAPHALLPTPMCETLASMGPVTDKRCLGVVLAGVWSLWDELGEELYQGMLAMDIPPLPPKKSRSKKRALDAVVERGNTDDQPSLPPSKRSRRDPTTRRERAPATSQDHQYQTGSEVAAHAPSANALEPPSRVDDENTAPLPDGWTRAYDPQTGRAYYVNHSAQSATWTHPAVLVNAPLRPLSDAADERPESGRQRVVFSDALGQTSEQATAPQRTMQKPAVGTGEVRAGDASGLDTAIGTASPSHGGSESTYASLGLGMDSSTVPLNPHPNSYADFWRRIQR